MKNFHYKESKGSEFIEPSIDAFGSLTNGEPCIDIALRLPTCKTRRTKKQRYLELELSAEDAAKLAHAILSEITAAKALKNDRAIVKAKPELITVDLGTTSKTYKEDLFKD